ncbi:MAG TPA: fused MFS/spermidine synthase [Rhizomicrobium sp.]|jgi:hypothetical protein
MASLDIPVPPRAISESGAIVSFCATIFLSAALLFCVEPMFSKMVLPVLGGSAAVWSIAMVVFQGLLLAGYVYAHLLSRYLSAGPAALIHITVMALGTVSLPIAISSHFTAPPDHHISFWLIGLFLASVGLPCFGISANAPLLQAWFAQTQFKSASNPYFLYRASNAGSFLVLLAYPFLIEPALGLSEQSMWWKFGYVLLMSGIALCGAFALLSRNPVQTVPARSSTAVTWLRRTTWVALGFVPSGLLVAVTAHIATDVASAPFLWIMPLALYLLTFVFAFADKPVIPLKALLFLQPLTIACLAVLFLWTSKISWTIALPCHLIAFFVAAMVCHTQLYRLRPEASNLTAFYAWMSFGGVLGGMFAALLAPHTFSTVLEYPLLAFAALLARPAIFAALRNDWAKESGFCLIFILALAIPFFFMAPAIKPAYFAIAVMAAAAFLAFQAAHPVRLLALAAIALLITNLYDPTQSILVRARSFYGVYKVVDVQNGQFRVFYDGTIAHGAEAVRDEHGHALRGRPEPTTYYYKGGAFREAMDAIRAFDGGKLPNVSLVGLGVGAITCYAQPDETWSLYELDPLVIRIAGDRVLYRSMSLCASRDPVVAGDGRLTLRDAKPGLDLLILDAFSSDAVPTHLLTREAFALYKQKLGPHGMLAFNISNKNLELADVVAASAAANGMVAAVKTGAVPPPSDHKLDLRAKIAIVAKSKSDLDALHLGPGWRLATPAARVWTDDYSNIMGAIIEKFRE